MLCACLLPFVGLQSARGCHHPVLPGFRPAALRSTGPQRRRPTQTRGFPGGPLRTLRPSLQRQAPRSGRERPQQPRAGVLPQGHLLGLRGPGVKSGQPLPRGRAPGRSLVAAHRQGSLRWPQRGHGSLHPGAGAAGPRHPAPHQLATGLEPGAACARSRAVLSQTCRQDRRRHDPFHARTPRPTRRAGRRAAASSRAWAFRA